MVNKPKSKKSRPEETKETKKNDVKDAPNWPPLQPLAPASDLALEVTLRDQIIVIPRLWTSSLCKRYVSFLSSLPLATTPGIPKRGEAVRVNDRFQIQDPAFAKSLWEQTALKNLILGNVESEEVPLDPTERERLWGGEVLGLNPNIRIYRYKKGHFFDQHYDESNQLMFPSDPPIPARTTWTLLLYLTSPATGCIGGETIFYPEPDNRKGPLPDPVVVGLEVGMGLLHRHGNECMLHEGSKVLEGEKWVLRSDLCVRR